MATLLVMPSNSGSRAAPAACQKGRHQVGLEVPGTSHKSGNEAYISQIAYGQPSKKCDNASFLKTLKNAFYEA